LSWKDKEEGDRRNTAEKADAGVQAVASSSIKFAGSEPIVQSGTYFGEATDLTYIQVN
jgi:hypothetical protein